MLSIASSNNLSFHELAVKLVKNKLFHKARYSSIIHFQSENISPTRMLIIPIEELSGSEEDITTDNIVTNIKFLKIFKILLFYLAVSSSVPFPCHESLICSFRSPGWKPLT